MSYSPSIYSYDQHYIDLFGEGYDPEYERQATLDEEEIVLQNIKEANEEEEDKSWRYTDAF